MSHRRQSNDFVTPDISPTEQQPILVKTELTPEQALRELGLSGPWRPLPVVSQPYLTNTKRKYNLSRLSEQLDDAQSWGENAFEVKGKGVQEEYVPPPTPPAEGVMDVSFGYVFFVRNGMLFGGCGGREDRQRWVDVVMILMNGRIGDGH